MEQDGLPLVPWGRLQALELRSLFWPPGLCLSKLGCEPCPPHPPPVWRLCGAHGGGFPWRMKPTAADQPIHGTTQPTPQHVASADISLSRILFSARL